MSLTVADKSFIVGAIKDTVQPIVDEAVESLAQTVNTAYTAMEADIAGLKLDVSELKDDMKDVKFKLSDTVQRTEYHDLRFRVEKLEQSNTDRG